MFLATSIKCLIKARNLNCFKYKEGNYEQKSNVYNLSKSKIPYLAKLFESPKMLGFETYPLWAKALSKKGAVP